MIRELLVRVSPIDARDIVPIVEGATSFDVQVMIVDEHDAVRIMGSLRLVEREIALVRAVVDALLPQLVPGIAVYWKDAPPAADDALGDGTLLKRVGQLAKVARSLKLLPS